jgi:CBS domain-containing protein
MPDRQTVRDVMTAQPIVLESSATVADAARQMKEHDVGDVLVRRDGKLCGIVTDRDIVVRAVAESESNPGSQSIADICSEDLECVEADAEVEEAIERMESRSIRRLAVVEDGEPLGVVSLGDLAIARDRNSLLGKISSAPPSR